jgi:thiol-disulfide isomerase/thioredoxin
MRKSVLFIGLLMISLVVSLCVAENPSGSDHLSFKPTNPVADTAFEINFNAKGTALEGSLEVQIAYYSNVLNKLLAHSLAMTKAGENWIAVITPEKGALSIAFKFFSGEVSDSNNGLGYGIELYGSDNEPLPGAKTELLYLQSQSALYLEINRNLAFKKNLFEALKNEFTVCPESRKKYASGYYSLLKTLFKAEGEQAVKDDIERQAERTDLTEDDLYNLYKLSNAYDLKNKVETLELKLKEKNPKHYLFENKKIMKYGTIKDESKRTRFLSEMRKEYPDNWNVAYWQKLEVLGLLEKKQIEKAQEYIKLNPLVGDCCYYSDGAEKIMEGGMDMDLALEMSRKGVELIRNNLISQKNKKTPSMTEYEWQKRQENHLARHLKTQGDVLMKLGKFDEAVKIYEEAIGLQKYQEPETNEEYCAALIKNGAVEKAIAAMTEYISNNTSTPKMEQIYIEAYASAKGNKADAETELNKLRLTAYDILKNKLKKELIDNPAPVFNLQDIEGKNVSLQEFKGKTVILDFWATWCGPCIFSFPTMQKLVDKYKDDNSIKFIFINTQDYDETINAQVKEFLAEDNYQFYVLLDDKYSQTFEDYALSGIPTKIFIDKTGKIRYSYVGWRGSEDIEMKMFEALIDLLR